MFRRPGFSEILSQIMDFTGGAPPDLANDVEVLLTGSVEPVPRKVMATRIDLRQPDLSPASSAAAPPGTASVRSAVTDVVLRAA